MIWATQHEKPGAAEKLIIWLYETLTAGFENYDPIRNFGSKSPILTWKVPHFEPLTPHKKIKKIQGEFTDFYTDESLGEKGVSINYRII